MSSRSRMRDARGGRLRCGRARRLVLSGGLLSAVVVSLSSLVVGALFAVAPVALAAESCSNAAFRVGLSSGLPDCRAYEMVTPPEKDSGEPLGVIVGSRSEVYDNEYAQEGIHASVTGDRLAFASEYVLPGSQSVGVGSYLATRGAGGWSTENMIPPQSPEKGLLCPWLVGMAAYSPDLSKGVLADGYGQEAQHLAFLEEEKECGHDEPRLVKGEPEGFQNLFVRDNDTRSYELVNVTPKGVVGPKPTLADGTTRYWPASFLAGSTDLSHVVFEEELALTPGAPSGDDLYEWTGGVVHLVTILPDGKTPVQGSLAGATKNFTEFPTNLANARYAVSANGSRVFFQAGGDLYVRENGDREPSPLDAEGDCVDPAKACTVQVDASQGSGPGGGGVFLAANASGSEVFFTDGDAAGLTGDTVPGSGQNLYEYDLETGKLTDLTPAGQAGVEGLSGTSEDGSYVYFVAEGVLASGATEGQPNLYLFHAGTTTFIATLDASTDSCDWMVANCKVLFESVATSISLAARVSPNGLFIGFNSDLSLTGYDNNGSTCIPEAHTGGPTTFSPGPCREIFLYDASAHRLTCASCTPGGAPPTASSVIREAAAPSRSAVMSNRYPRRNVSDNGQVFFETLDALLPQDTNGKFDVYEYEHGRLYLLSSGTSEANSVFYDASVSGDDVFLATAEQLLPRDTDAVYDIYDARVGGGFSEPAAGPAPCNDEYCRGPLAAVPVFSAPVSAGFVGSGNLTPVVAVKETPKRVLKKPKKRRKHPVKKKRVAAKKKGRGKGLRRAERAAHGHRGGGK